MYARNFCKLKSGEVVGIWSDNFDDNEKTMHVFPMDQDFDAEWDICDIVKYDEIEHLRCDRNGDAVQ